MDRGQHRVRVRAGQVPADRRAAALDGPGQAGRRPHRAAAVHHRTGLQPRPATRRRRADLRCAEHLLRADQPARDRRQHSVLRRAGNQPLRRGDARQRQLVGVHRDQRAGLGSGQPGDDPRVRRLPGRHPVDLDPVGNHRRLLGAGEPADERRMHGHRPDAVPQPGRHHRPDVQGDAVGSVRQGGLHLRRPHHPRVQPRQRRGDLLGSGDGSGR